MRVELVPGRALSPLLPLMPLTVFALVLLAQLPLVLNPGYFSHDELQWAAYAEAGQWVSWTAIDAFQYRPLTFNLWQWLSRHLFDVPQAFHAVVVALGALNAALAAWLLRRLQTPPVPAMWGAALFALGPYAAYVHGWIGTLGDLIWLGCALATALLVCSRCRLPALIAATALLTVVALLAKEAAVVIPALLALCAWLLPDRRRWAAAAIATAIPVMLYLGLRHGVLLHAPRAGGQYALSLAHVPWRWLEYQLYLFNPPLFETRNTLDRGLAAPRNLVAATVWLTLLVTLSRLGWRWAAAFLVGGLAALGPVLLLASAGNQYAYGFAAVTAMVTAAAWPRAPRWGRVAMMVAAVLTLWHGVNVMRQMRVVGERQAVFSPSLARALAGHEGAPLRLRMHDRDEAWIYQRFTHQIPSYDGIAIGDRARIVESSEDADLIILADGSLALPR